MRVRNVQSNPWNRALFSLLLFATGCGRGSITPVASRTVKVVRTTTSTPVHAVRTATPAVPLGDLCQEYLELWVSSGGVEERAVATSYLCGTAAIDSTGQSPSLSPAWVVSQGTPLHLRFGVDQRPAAVDVRLYPQAGVSASFLRWPEELPTQLTPVERYRLDPGADLEVLPGAQPGEYSLVVRATWEESVDVFYAVSFVLEDTPSR
jgi:hypothetical protein